MTETVSIVVTTYNWPAALAMVLKSLTRQNVRNFEVVIADDGSGPETSQLISDIASSLNYPLHHVWQEDKGFRAALCRNKAVLKSTGEYLIFLDGDCIVRPDFVQQHLHLKEAGWFVRGNRVKLSDSYTQFILESKSEKELAGTFNIVENWIRGNIKRIMPLLRLPLGRLRYRKKDDWYGVKTCNLAISRQDFFAVNGFNEDFEGWGHEDADLAIRLIRNGVHRKEGTFATAVFHCFHNEVDRSDESKNRAMLEDSYSGDIFAENGLLKK